MRSIINGLHSMLFNMAGQEAHGLVARLAEVPQVRLASSELVMCALCTAVLMVCTACVDFQAGQVAGGLVAWLAEVPRVG
jgi:hypothetical protein